MTYAEQLLDRRWQEKKVRILTRDSFKCQCAQCSNKNPNATLEVHHKMYISGTLAWEYTDDMLITLCSECHDKEKGRKKMETDLATSFEANGFLYSDLKCLTSMLYFDQPFTNGLLNYLRKHQDA